MNYRPTQAQILILKKPLGELLKGSPRETMRELNARIKEYRPVRIAAVGDVVSAEVKEAGIKSNLRVIDHKTMRRETSHEPERSDHTFRLANPAGVITEEAFTIIHDATRFDDALVIVNGEEDLLTIPVVLELPNRSIVIYGQPSEGIVVLKVDNELKQRVRDLLENMDQEN